jgi:hypothetical protein
LGRIVHPKATPEIATWLGALLTAKVEIADAWRHAE